MVTGFPGTAEVNKAMLQNEVNFTVSVDARSCNQTQVIPEIINPGIGMPMFQYPVNGPNVEAVGNPALEIQCIKTFTEVYKGRSRQGSRFRTEI